MSKQLLFGNDCLYKMVDGANILANAVKVTLGAKGRNVIIERPYTYPLITNDGVSIAKEIELKDRFENMGAKLVTEVASKTNKEAGDGTTTSIVIAQGMINKGVDCLNDGFNPVTLKKGMKAAEELIIKYISDNSRKVKSKEDIKSVATISSGSEEIGKIISEGFDKVGFDGSLTIEDSDNSETYLEVTEGIEYEQGYMNPYFCTNMDKLECYYEDCLMLVTDKRINSFNEILSCVQYANRTNKPIMIVANDFSNEVIRVLVQNKLNGGLNCVCVKCPGFGENLADNTEDLSYLVGAVFVPKTHPGEFDQKYLGVAKSIKVTKDKTVIIGEKTERLQDRISQLKEQLKEKVVEIDKENLLKRIGRLSNGVGVIKVGGQTETEQEEMKLRIEDAVNATKAAIEDGIVIGGGMCLLNAHEYCLDKLEDFTPELQPGINIVLDALCDPFKQIVKNAGSEENVPNTKHESYKDTYVFDVVNEKWVNGFESGIVDPAKVTKNAIKNAVSITSLFLTTDVGIAEKDED